MLNSILEATGLDSQTCADLLGINRDVLVEWTAAQRSIPESYVALLSDALGVDVETLTKSVRHSRSQRDSDITPAIWYKFKGENLVSADREAVFLIRQIGHFQNEIEHVTGKRSVAWKPTFDAIRKEIDSQAPPGEQGRKAARILRESTGLAHGATGIGEVFRGNLRRQGILIIESPLPESRVEGCSYNVGAHPDERPCIFANTHHTTWFRRNAILIHELGHAIFDSTSAAASLDFRGFGEGKEVSEQRAEAFAQEALIPREVLFHAVQSHGIKWDSISAEGLATLVATTHVELRMVIKAAASGGFISDADAERLSELNITEYLRSLSDHALTTTEYLATLSEEKKSKLLIGNRTATNPSRSIRLPIQYVMTVVEAVRDRQISTGKAAEFLMISKQDLESRFGNHLGINED